MAEFFDLDYKVYQQENLVLKKENEFKVFAKLSKLVVATNVNSEIVSDFLNKYGLHSFIG